VRCVRVHSFMNATGDIDTAIHSVCPSVSLSVTLRYCIKWLNISAKMLSPADRPSDCGFLTTSHCYKIHTGSLLMEASNTALYTSIKPWSPMTLGEPWPSIWLFYSCRWPKPTNRAVCQWLEGWRRRLVVLWPAAARQAIIIGGGGAAFLVGGAGWAASAIS